MDRADAMAYINSEFSKLIAEVGLSPTDDAAGFSYAIDNALREYGIAPDDFDDFDTPPDQEDELQSLLDYFALRRIQRAAAAKVDVSSGASGTSKSRSQLSVQIADLLTFATERAQAYGYVVTKSWGGGEINLDFIEAQPESAAEFG
jgi:hypothetical protein